VDSEKTNEGVPDDRQERMRAAAEKMLELADRGPWFTTDPGSVPREDLHERW